MTGGKAVFSSSEAENQQMARKIVDALHYEYRIGFYNSEPFAQSGNIELHLPGRPSAGVIVKGLSVRVPRALILASIV